MRAGLHKNTFRSSRMLQGTQINKLLTLDRENSSPLRTLHLEQVISERPILLATNEEYALSATFAMDRLVQHFYKSNKMVPAYRLAIGFELILKP